MSFYVRDISVRKHMDAELRRRSQELEEASRRALRASQAKSDFLANVSHELRTPLHGVLSSLSLLEATVLTAQQQEHTRLTRGSAEALLDLVNDILDFANLESGDSQVELLPTSLEDLRESLDRKFQHHAQSKGLDLKLEIASPVPRIITDPARLRQILQALLANAIKFTESGTVHGSLELLDDGKRLRVIVADTGIGISKEQQSDIFELFTQGDTSTTRRFGGTGLGLALCRRLVDLLQGSLVLDSLQGRGTRVVVTIPVVLPEAPPSAPQSRVQNELRVLVVEDHPVNQRVMKLLLTQLGHQAVVAANGLEAIDHHQQGEFDLILMDLQMPGVSGLEATRKIRERERASGRRRTPIVALTARALPHDREECLEAGMDDYLTKPLSLPQLEQLLQGLGGPRSD